MKKIMSIVIACAAFCSANLFAMASDCPAEAKQCPQKKEVGKRQFKKQKQARRPRPKMSEEAKAEMALFRKTVKEYRENQTPENKAKLAELLGKKFDKRLAMSKKHAENMKKAAAAIEKKNAEMEKNRDAEIEKMIKNILNPPKRPQFKGPRKKAPAPAKTAAPAPAAPAQK